MQRSLSASRLSRPFGRLRDAAGIARQRSAADRHRLGAGMIMPDAAE